MSADTEYLPAHELSWHHARQDERLLLGAALLDEGVAAEAVVLVPVDDLALPEHRALLRLIGLRLSLGQSVTMYELVQAVHGDGTAAMYGGVSYLSELPEHCPSPRIDLPALAQRIRSRATSRVLVEVAESLAAAGAGRRATLDGDALPDAPEAVAAVVSEYLSRIGQPAKRVEWSVGEAADRAVERRAEARDSQKGRPVATGIADLDELLDGGFRAGQLVVVAGRPGGGKTAFALGAAANAAELGGRVGFISLEMEADEVADRVLSRIAPAPLGVIRSGLKDDDDEMRAWRAYLHEWALQISAPPTISAAEIAAQARRWQARGGLSMLVVDYLQLVQHGRADRHDLAVGRTATACKELARALQVPVVLLSQLNREIEKRGGSKRSAGLDWWDGVSLPRLADLRDSGQIEQDADIVLFPVRAGQYDIDLPHHAAVVVAKHRNGRTGVAPAKWDGPTASYNGVDA